MTKKMIRVTMGDGSKWDVPMDVVATSFATHWANKSYPPATSPKFKWDKAFETEYEWATTCVDTTLDWAVNNMDWNDVARHAVRVNPSRPADYQEGWVNGEKEVVEVEQ
jgi:hypothetical protein